MEEAISLTWKTMADRLRNLRIGAFAGLGAVMALPLLAILCRSWWVLAGLPAIALLGAAFMQRERGIVFAWEDRILALWGTSDLCMGLFVRAMADPPHALRRSLQSLVASLPENPDLLVPAPDQIRAHRGLFWTRAFLQDIRFLRAAALNFALACLPVSALWISESGWPWILLAASPMAAPVLAERHLSRIALSRWKNRLDGLVPGPAGWEAGFASRLDALDWSRIPRRFQAAIYGMSGRKGR